MQDPSRWRRFWGPDPVRDVDDELSFHLELKRQELRAAGVPPSELESVLAREFGDRQRIERELREIGMKRLRRARRASLLDEVRVDLLHAWRSFRRRPAVPAVIVGTLGLSIGAGTAVFSMFDAVLLNPLAVQRPHELVMLYDGDNRLGFSYPMLQHVREHSTMADVAASVAQSVALRSGDRADQLDAGLVTGNYFGVLGLQPQVGRLLMRADEVAPGETPHVVLSDGLWRRAFGADPAVVGRTVSINEQPFEVVGVAPPRFRGTSLANPVDLWLPLPMASTVARAGLWADPEALTTWFFTMLEPVARIRTGLAAEAALAELRTLHASGGELAAAAESDGQGAPGSNGTLTAVPLTEAAAARSREDLLRFMLLLGAAVAIALAVACVNVANLMLMRGTERQRELSIRAAVGASRRRVVRQLLVESTTLALAGGLLGAGIALLALRLLTAFALPGGIALSELALPMDGRMLGFTAAVSMLCALGFGLAPALSGSRVGLMNAMRASTDGASGRWRGGSALLAVQVSLSLVLLVAGSLFVRSLQLGLSVDLGFRSDGVAAVSVGLQQHGYSGSEADLFVARVLEETLRQPGVHRVAAGSRVPLEASSRLPVSSGGVQGNATPGTGRREAIAIISISPGYLDAVGLRLLRGRDIDWSDREGAPLVALVTESTARRMWPDEDAVGQELVVMFGQPYTVVGVVADAHLARLTDTESHVFLAMLQRRTFTMDRMRLVAAADNPGVALGALRSAVQSVDRRLPTYQERSLQQHVAALLMPQRFGSTLLAAFGALALLIAAIGIYAVAAYDVARRYREIGIRAALGAGRLQLLRLVLSRAGASIAAGIAAGVLLAAYATRGLQTLLFGISNYDAVSYVAAVLVLAVVAVMATWLPARRAARIDPLVVMRE